MKRKQHVQSFLSVWNERLLSLFIHSLFYPFESFQIHRDGNHSIGSLSTRVFKTRTPTGREHFKCHDNGVSQIFTLIISNGEKILSNINLVE